MKKILIPVVAFAFLFAGATPAQAVTDWDVTGTYVWDVFGTYFHDITIDVQNPDGTFSGYGGWPAGSDPYSTTELISGVVDGDNFSFTTVYEGPYAPGSVFNMTGTIDGDGHISGTSPWVWQFTGDVATKDIDDDGVLDGDDLCPGTTPDDPDELGTNRWWWDGDSWKTNSPKGKGPQKTFTIQQTQGCSGEEILAILEELTGQNFEGHHKFGVS